jgi:hypothetical protein
MLPKRNYCAFDDIDDQTLFSQAKEVIYKELNPHMLTIVYTVTFQWVYSRTSQTFRYHLHLPIIVILCFQSLATRNYTMGRRAERVQSTAAS